MRLPGWVRRLTDPLTERIPVPVVSGVNAGRWWGLASAGSGYASGCRAAEQMMVLRALLRDGDTVWDVGAHHGYVTLLACRCVGPSGAVHAFEPSTANGRILRRHLLWNGCRNAFVHAVALGDADGEARFGGGPTSKMHALGQGEERVSVRCGAAMVSDGACAAPTFLKVDVEGAEGAFLEGCGSMLAPGTRAVIAIHSAEADRRCSAWLDAHGFVQMPSRALVAARVGPWHADPDVYVVGPGGDADGAMRRTLVRLGAIDA
ncbi:MAG: FkbM family methyltransferase [Gemmatimonadaceae bacterium]